MKPSMRMPSTMKGGHSFSQVPKATIERSVFDRSHGYKTTFNAGYLVPFYVDEALPGDTFTLRTAGFCRLATAIKPVMDNLYLETFFFFVPYRLIWSNFKKMMGEQATPGDSIAYTTPQMIGGGADYTNGSVFDYMGLPLAADVTGTYTHSALPIRAYSLVFNEWFRDENLVIPLVVSLSDGPDASANVFLMGRGKRHDYFTSALPFTQKGTAVTLPLGTSAPVIPNTTTSGPSFHTATRPADAAVFAVREATTSPLTQLTGFGAAPAAFEAAYWTATGLKADLSTATAATINAIRQAFQIQKLLERDARGGTRYTEIIRSHFGVVSPDARLQRSEYLGGGHAVISISPIASTSSVPSQTVPQGNLAGIGTGSFQGHGFAKSFTEHGVVLGIMNVRADLSYQQGLDKMWSRLTRYDYYWPAFAHLGEQAVLNIELYTKGDANDALVFGYQERYAEYRYKQSRITGVFRSTYATTIDVWHLSQKFTSLPVLNNTFIRDTPPIARIKAVSTEPDFICDMFLNLRCARPMPVFGVPGLVDHF